MHVQCICNIHDTNYMYVHVHCTCIVFIYDMYNSSNVVLITGVEDWVPGSPWKSNWKFSIRLYLSCTIDAQNMLDVLLKVNWTRMRSIYLCMCVHCMYM